jgi:hypothetical protein
MPAAGWSTYLVCRTDVDLAVQQQPYNIKATACSGKDQSSVPVLCVGAGEVHWHVVVVVFVSVTLSVCFLEKPD